MMKYVIFLSIFLFGCTEHNENYYLKHPKKLEQALMVCERTQSMTSACKNYSRLANRMNILIDALKQDRLLYGQTILALQMQQDEDLLQLTRHVDTKEVKKHLARVQTELYERLMIIRWLESPRSRA